VASLAEHIKGGYRLLPGDSPFTPPQKGLTAFAVKALVFSVAEELMPGSFIDDDVSMAFLFFV
jgi:hypothetical protein